MAPDAARLLADVLALPRDQRRRLVAEVMASLGPADAPPAEVAAAWAHEIHHRLDRRTGAAEGVAWPTMRDDMLAELRDRRDRSR